MTLTPQQALLRCIEHREIFHDEMLELFRQIMGGEMSPVMIAALTMGLRVKKETIGEIAAAAQVMREFATKVVVPDAGHLVDIVGTGGDGSGTFNISTATALVLSGAGAKVAKHGNRSLATSSGSADVLEALGVRIALTPDEARNAIQQIGIGFLFAPNLHPSMKHAQPVRRELKIRTAMNFLGPLCNPARAQAQLIGAPHATIIMQVEKLDGALHSAAELCRGVGGEYVGRDHGARRMRLRDFAASCNRATLPCPYAAPSTIWQTTGVSGCPVCRVYSAAMVRIKSSA